MKYGEELIAQNFKSAKEVLERNEKCKADKVCYVSLRPLTDENVFTLTTKEGQFSMLKKYGEQAVELYK